MVVELKLAQLAHLTYSLFRSTGVGGSQSLLLGGFQFILSEDI